jgi:hypothetical protein
VHEESFMLRTLVRSGGILLATLLIAAPAAAQVVHSVHFGGGVFLPRGFDTRVDGDTLVANLVNEEPLLYEISDFRGGQVFGEWNVTFGQRVEEGAGVGYYGRTVPSVYRSLVNEDGFEIEQDLRLRIVPLTGIVRFLPFGEPHQVQPYVGAGVAILNWRYSEAGEFVDTSDFSIFGARFTETGSDVGGIVLGGVRIPIDGDIYGLTLEYRYQFGSGNTGGLDAGFLGDKIDLSGGMFNIGFLIRF